MLGKTWKHVDPFWLVETVETVETHHLLSPSPKNAAQLASWGPPTRSVARGRHGDDFEPGVSFSDSRPGKRLQFTNLKMAIDSGFTYQ